MRPIKIIDDIAIIPLTKGYEAIVDASDASSVEMFLWHAMVHRGSKTTYACRRLPRNVLGKQPQEYLHQHILGVMNGMQMNGNTIQDMS